MLAAVRRQEFSLTMALLDTAESTLTVLLQSKAVGQGGFAPLTLSCLWAFRGGR